MTSLPFMASIFPVGIFLSSFPKNRLGRGRKSPRLATSIFLRSGTFSLIFKRFFSKKASRVTRTLVLESFN